MSKQRLLERILAQPDGERVTLHLLADATGYSDWRALRAALSQHGVPCDERSRTVRVGDLRKFEVGVPNE